MGGFSVNSGGDYDEENAASLVKAYELFKTFKLLFVGLILNSSDLEAIRRMFKYIDSENAFRIVEMELGFLYDLIYTKVPLLNCAWGIIRWVVNLSVPGAVLVLLSLLDKKDYPKVDICITFLLISGTIILEIYSFLQTISSDWVDHWQIQRPRRTTISFAVDFLGFLPNQRWGNSVAQFSLLRLFIRKRNRIFRKYPRLTKLDEKLEKHFYIGDRVQEKYQRMDLPSSEEYGHRSGTQLWTTWSSTGAERSILIWHIATELWHYKDRGTMQSENLEYVTNFKMSKLVSRYMLYLLVFQPSKLPTVIGEVRYEDTLADARKFFEDKKEAPSTSVCRCNKAHKSRELHHLCAVCDLLLRTRTDLPPHKLRGDKSTSVLYDGCRLASQLQQDDQKWRVISLPPPHSHAPPTARSGCRLARYASTPSPGEPPPSPPQAPFLSSSFLPTARRPARLSARPGAHGIRAPCRPDAVAGELSHRRASAVLPGRPSPAFPRTHDGNDRHAATAYVARRPPSPQRPCTALAAGSPLPPSASPCGRDPR
ncbi:hypothetical protein NL676_018455 [Syzygium grande]|nr:hypothetical protein NL676_018455 [Syzygium grande]